MDFAVFVTEFLKYTVPALAVVGGVWLVLERQRSRDEQQMRWQHRTKVLDQYIPLQISAYERAILFLERLHPGMLVLRIGTAGKNADLLYAEMVAAIRDEYEHNLVQQLYVTPAAWAALVQAREEVMALIHTAYRETGGEAEALALGKKIFEKSQDIQYLQNAIAMFKSDVAQVLPISAAPNTK
ncbi:MAG: hypothetical protein SF053_21290 [Bacteroidia bacterium]|nr:hypothetical protein [Bacteroidia bacterium]